MGAVAVEVNCESIGERQRKISRISRNSRKKKLEDLEKECSRMLEKDKRMLEKLERMALEVRLVKKDLEISGLIQSVAELKEGVAAGRAMLKCIVCRSIPPKKTKMRQCVNGHLICQVCIDDWQLTCFTRWANLPDEERPADVDYGCPGCRDALPIAMQETPRCLVAEQLLAIFPNNSQDDMDMDDMDMDNMYTQPPIKRSRV